MAIARRRVHEAQLGFAFAVVEAPALLPAPEAPLADAPLPGAPLPDAPLPDGPVSAPGPDPAARAAEIAPAPPPVSRTKALVAAVQAALGRHVKLVLTDNKSTLLSQSTKDGVTTVRVHQMFLDADDEVRRALARYLADGDARAGALVDEFVDESDHLLDFAARPWPPDAHVGRAHDLLPIFVELNASYFGGAIRSEIGWGQAGHAARRGRTSITLGSYDGRARRIVIHPALDQPHVPRLVVARIVHHEMLHEKHGETRDPAGRRIVHGPEFRREEAQFAGAREADAWIDRHLDALLRFKPEGRRGREMQDRG